MCGRIEFTNTIDSVRVEYRASGELEFAKRYNVAPTQDVPVVTAIDGKHREVKLMNWGLVPSWAKDPSIGNRMINARAETLSEKPSFKSAYRSRRCIVPASGFYEWKSEGSSKQPYYFTTPNKAIVSLAGLWESWEDPDQVIESFTIITTQANNLMRPIHDRMPVIIAKDYYEQWLNCRDYQSVSHLLKPAPDDFLVTYPVSRLVNNPANDSWKCSRPLDDSTK